MPEQTTLLSQQWQDILSPLPPAPVSQWLVFAGLCLLGLVVIVVYVLWQQRPRQRALRELRQCARQLQQAQYDAKQLLTSMHRLLLQGLELNPATVLSRHHKREVFWELYYRQLQQYTFRAAAPSRDELARLLRQTHYWLRHYPR